MKHFNASKTKQLATSLALFALSYLFNFQIQTYAQAPNMSVLFYDDFSANNSTQIELNNSQWASSSNGVVELFPYTHVQNNRAFSYNTSEYYVKNFASQKDQCASINYLNESNKWFNLKVREKENEITFYMTSIAYGELFLRKYVNGNITLLASKNLNYQYNEYLNLKVCAVGNQITVNINDNPEIDVTDDSIKEGTTGFSTKSTTFDNYLYEGFNQATRTVPLFKQGLAPFPNGDPVWEGEEFDHAGGGQFSCGTTMAQCGCSTTSIAMVFKYHGIDKLPDGTELTPGTLNTWLKENRGYNRNAGVDWRVAATLTKKAKVHNPNFQYNALEYKRGNSEKQKLTEDLNNGIPNILEVPGHFIVGTGVEQDTYTINDPFYNRTTLNAYNNSFASTRRYIPSNTDLSYITLYADPDINLVLKDKNGNVVGETETEYEVNDATTTAVSPVLKPSLKVLSYAKPNTDIYTIEVSGHSSKAYQLDITIIDKDGNVAGDSFDGYVSSNKNNNFTLAFNKESADANRVTKIITFSSTRNDISHAEKYNNINRGLAISLKAILSTAEFHSYRNKFVTRKLLEGGLKFLSESKQYSKLINHEAYEIIYADFTALINNYK